MLARITVLILADMLTVYALWMLMIYLTDVWKVTFVHAAGILNIYLAVSGVLPLILQLIVDTLVGNFWVLLLSSLSFCTGMGFLTMSTPPVLHKSTGTCGSYEPECIGDTQKALFYTALALIAVGTAGHIISLISFLDEQIENVIANFEDISIRGCLVDGCGSFAAFAMGCFAVIGLPYIKPWSLRFGIPAIIILAATLIFLSGSCLYSYVGPQGSYLVTVFRVIMAAASKLFHRLPADRNELHGMADLAMPRTTGLRCLDKAAIVLPDQSVEEQKNRRKLWTVSEVEATKFILSLIPMSTSFTFFGLVSSLGYTFFVEQGKNMNHKVGKLTVPLTIFWWFCDQACSQFPKVFSFFFNLVCKTDAQKMAPTVNLIVSMILGVLCSVTSAKVESRRLDVVKSHGLLDKPDETIPMTVFWLLPQFLLLGASKGMYETSLESYYSYYTSPTVFKYMLQINRIGESLGFIGGIVAVYVLGKVSERGGKPSWFQDTINHSRLDNYYWFLSCVCAVNLVLFVVLRCCCFCSSTENDAEEQEDAGGEGGSNDVEIECGCCFS